MVLPASQARGVAPRCWPLLLLLLLLLLLPSPEGSGSDRLLALAMT
jgi:hypothetical protein